MRLLFVWDSGRALLSLKTVRVKFFHTILLGGGGLAGICPVPLERYRPLLSTEFAGFYPPVAFPLTSCRVHRGHRKIVSHIFRIVSTVRSENGPSALVCIKCIP